MIFRFLYKYQNSISISTIYFLGILSGLMLTSISINAQTDTAPDSSEYQFWYTNMDARSTALANAGVADPLNESGIYSNPALIGLNSLKTTASIHSFYNRAKDIAVENITVPINLTTDKTIAVGATFHHQLKPQSRLVTNTGLYFNQYTLDVAYAQQMIEDVHIGLKVQSYLGVTESETSWSGDARVGILYVPSPLVSYGIVYSGTGYQGHRIGHGLIYYRTEGDEATQIETVRRPQRLEIGASLRFPSVKEYPDFVLSFSNEKLFGEEGLIYRGGLEVYLNHIVSLRGGYFHSSTIQGGRAGLGIRIEQFKIDYSYSLNDLDRTGRSHQMSISLNF